MVKMCAIITLLLVFFGYLASCAMEIMKFMGDKI